MKAVVLSVWVLIVVVFCGTWFPRPTASEEPQVRPPKFTKLERLKTRVASICGADWTSRLRLTSTREWPTINVLDAEGQLFAVLQVKPDEDGRPLLLLYDKAGKEAWSSRRRSGVQTEEEGGK